MVIQSPPPPGTISDDDIDAFIADLTPAQRDILWKHPASERRAIVAAALYMRPAALESKTINHQSARNIPLKEWAERNYYIPETRLPIRFMPHQAAILDYALDPANNFQTIVYSTIKKSGKTAIGACVARWMAETWGYGTEIYMVANDAEQARSRQYASLLTSIKLTPGYLSQKQVLSGRWHVIEREARYLPTSSTVQALSGDYRGQAGSNPTATFWSELWGFTKEASRRLYEELTPVPTRARSIRFVETYAGYSDESDLLLDLYNQATRDGRRLTREDFPNWPYSEDEEPELPLYVNPATRLFAYWDTGIVARRMPWQRGAEGRQYYQTQESALRPEVYARLHMNEWTSNTSSFLPIQWYDHCVQAIPPLLPGDRTPIVVGVDGAVSSDCAAVVGVSRDPRNSLDIMERFNRVWTPPKGGYIDLEEVSTYLREVCARYNVVEIAYDAYQLHHLMTELYKANVAWCKPFSQGATREIADKQFYDLIRDRRYAHSNDTLSLPRTHVANAGAKMAPHEDSKLRLVKKSKDGKIDYTVAASQACYEALRLVLN